MRVLLVEPMYKNKYPPMGLMKISTYHKNRGDIVHFFKGTMKSEEFKQNQYERIYITTLFTFYYDKVISTIKYYEELIDKNCIYVGGIMVTILEDKIRKEMQGIHLMTGLLTDSACMGLGDHVNVDELPLDYGILDEIEYQYPAEGNYFTYTTRGCPNHCKFCAVPILEPEYQETNRIICQIEGVNREFGEKRNLLLMDNNIFNLEEDRLKKLVWDIEKMGFTKEPTYLAPTPVEKFYKAAGNPRMHARIASAAIAWLEKRVKNIKNEDDKKELTGILDILSLLREDSDKKQFLLHYQAQINRIMKRIVHRKRVNRYVDFNQGLEAARMTPDKMKILARLPLRPVRIAFDHYNPAAVSNYKRAVKVAVDAGIKEFSNYMLYNFDDKPEDLWYRLRINIDLSEQYGIEMFSFPMKYMPITETDRSHIGPNWNRKYLRAVQAILLVTKGIVADGRSFFERAFGKTVKEFLEILAMPKDFIIYRKYYEENGLAAKWKMEYRRLTEIQREKLIRLLSADAEITTSCLMPISQYYKKEYHYTEMVRAIK